MIDLMNLVQSLDPKMLKAEMDKQGIPYINVKPLLNFIADKTNEKRPLEGSWYAVPTMCDIIGVSRSTLYKMRDAAERLGLISHRRPGRSRRAWQVIRACAHHHFPTLSLQKTL